jgi:transposase
MQHYVGLDVSLKQTAVCVVDETGKVQRESMVQDSSWDWLCESSLKLEVDIKASSTLRSTSASMARSAGRAICILQAESAIALSKQADQSAAKSCAGLVPIRAAPGIKTLISRQPSELRDAPRSRPPVVRVLAV